MKALSLVAPFLLVTACSDGGGKKPMIIPDAPMNQIDAPMQPACSAEPTFTMATNFSFDYTQDRDPDLGDDGMPGTADDGAPGDQEYWATIGDLNADPTPDWIWVELYEGPPPDFTYANLPAAPFTVQIVGNEVDYFKCSMCVTLTTDVDTANMSYGDDYMAVAGSVKITALTATTITGELQNVKFNHVDFMEGQTQANPSGCKSDGPAVLPFTAQMMAFENGKAKFGIRGVKGRGALKRR